MQSNRKTKKFFLLISLVSLFAGIISLFHQLESNVAFFENGTAIYHTFNTAFIFTTVVVLFFRSIYSQAFLFLNFFTSGSLLISLLLWTQRSMYPFLDVFTALLLTYATICLIIANSKTIKSWQISNKITFTKSSTLLVVPILLNLMALATIFYQQHIRQILEHKKEDGLYDVKEASFMPIEIKILPKPKPEPAVINEDVKINLDGIWKLESVAFENDSVQGKNSFLESIKDLKIEIGNKKIITDSCKLELKTRQVICKKNCREYLKLNTESLKKIGIDKFDQFIEISLADTVSANKFPYKKIYLVGDKLLIENNQNLFSLIIDSLSGLNTLANISLPLNGTSQFQKTVPYTLNFHDSNLEKFRCGENPIQFFVLPSKGSIRNYIFIKQCEESLFYHLVTFKDGIFLDDLVIYKNEFVSSNKKKIDKKYTECYITKDYTIELSHSYTKIGESFNNRKIDKFVIYYISKEGKFTK